MNSFINHILDYKIKRIEKLIIFFGIIFLFYMATKSTGYYHADEHYQIIEFAGVKLGTHTPDEMVWEYSRRIRPTLQPTIIFIGVSAMKTIGIANPYSQILIFRLLTSIFAIFVLLFFNQSMRLFLKQEQHQSLLLFLTFFIWFLPFLMVRFSSETLSGLFFLFGLSLVLKSLKQTKLLLLAGIILGIGFLFRYQIGLSIFGLITWLVFVQKLRLSLIFKLIAGIAITVIIGTGIDCWFYDQLAFAPWRFLMALLSTSGEGFGQSPWYFYLQQLIFQPHFLLGIPILTVVFYGFYKQKSSIILWCILPFILFHFFIPHKEIRFLFPIAFLMPFILFQGLSPIIEVLSKKRYLKILGFSTATVVIILNLSVLFISAQKPAGMGRTAITQYIHDNYSNQKITLIHTPWMNVYNPWNSIPMKFYTEKKLESFQIQSIKTLNDSLINPKSTNLLVTSINSSFDSGKQRILTEAGFVARTQNMPTWVFDIIKYTNPKSDLKLIILYESKVQ